MIHNHENQVFLPMKLHLGSIDSNSAKRVVVGRKGLVQKLWQGIERGSLRLLSERRMGKTWFLHLAIAERPEWALPLFFDVEHAKSVAEFVYSLNDNLHKSKLVTDDWKHKVEDWFRRWI